MANVASTREATMARAVPVTSLARWQYLVLGLAIVTVIEVFYRWWQGMFAFTKGLDSTHPDFWTYWMPLLYIELPGIFGAGAILWYWIWRTRDRNLDNLPPQVEFRRWVSFLMWLIVYAYALYWGASFYTEQDAAWHNVVIRDTSFTPSHITEFYMSYPVYIVFGVASWLWARTRLPAYSKGFSVPLTLAIIGPYMILPNVGLNEFGHAFWIMEELFVAPLHWGFVTLGWAGLCILGVLVQGVLRCSRLLAQMQESRAGLSVV